MISFDAAHRAVHYPPDRRFRIWIRPSILIGIVGDSCRNRGVPGLSSPWRACLMFHPFPRYIPTTSPGRTGFRSGSVTATSSISFL